MDKTSLFEFLETQDYFMLMEVPDRGICGLIRMAYTVGLCYNLDESSYEGRYCFPSVIQAAAALALWTGKGDPKGDWIKHKGIREYSNPNYWRN